MSPPPRQQSESEEPRRSPTLPDAAPEEATVASPPLPPKPVALTPGPRARRLQQLYLQSLNHALNKISWDNFSGCYPTIASQAPAVLKAVQRQMVDRLAQLCNKEFDLIMANRNVVAKLNELESLVADATIRRDEEDRDASGLGPIAPHTLPPETILAAHLAPHLAAHQSQLNARIQTIQARNASAWEEVQSQRAEIMALLEGLDTAVGDLDGACKLLDPIVDDLSKETRHLEMEMENLQAGASSQ